MSQYISVLKIDRKAQKKLKISDLYSLHRVVYSLFDDVRNIQEKRVSLSSGIQWVDKGGDEFHRQILILSDRLPCPERQPSILVNSKIIDSSFLGFKSYRFTTVINPTKRSSQERRLIPIIDHDKIVEWFALRCEKNWGFRINAKSLQVMKAKVHQFRKGTDNLTIQQVELSGVLFVTDDQLFREAFMSGIGRCRSFGCGLLQIVPILDSPFISAH